MRLRSDGSCVRNVSRERYVGGSVMEGGGVNGTGGLSRANSVWGIGSREGSVSEVRILAMRYKGFNRIAGAGTRLSIHPYLFGFPFG